MGGPATGGDPAPALPGYVRRVLAPNAGPMTLEGTNTWLVGDPAAPVVVVDPGPADDGHLAAVLRGCPAGVAAVVLTHRHPDHAEAAAILADRTGCEVRAADPRLRVGPAGLADGDVVEVPGVRLEVVATPGHTDDSVSLLAEGADGAAWVLSGDTVLGRGSSVIAAPDGDLRAYLRSLHRLQVLVRDREVRAILPGHGPVVADPTDRLGWYARHRRERVDQVRAAVAAGARTPEEVVARVYVDVDRSLWPAAGQTVAAVLAYLDEEPGGTELHRRAPDHRASGAGRDS